MMRFFFAFFLCAPLFALDIRLGLKNDITSVDPHYHVWGPNMALSRHIFEPLIAQDEMQRLKPCLATAWRFLSPTKLELTLKQGVLFHDGTPFSADDAIYSLKRAQQIFKPFGGFQVYTQHIKRIYAKSPHILIVETAEPYALLASDLAVIGMMKKQNQELSADKINEGFGAVGTGPYVFEKWEKGNAVFLKRFERYHAQKPPFEKAIFRIISNDMARLNGLLAGDVDLIETLPLGEMERFKKAKDFALFSGVPSRLIYLVPDMRAKSPHVFTKKGGPNPLQDKRVRQALSYAIHRQSLCDDLMQGFAKPAGQIVPEGSLGYNAALKPDDFDLQKAQKLLSDAGFHDGDMRLTLHSPQGRYVFDAKIVEALVPMFARLGIETTLELMPPALFMAKSRTGDFSLSLGGWPVNREVISPLKALFCTKNIEKGFGNFNRGFYSSAKLDDLVAKALQTMDEQGRAERLKEASRTVIQDYALIPLMFQYNTWAAKKGLRYRPRMDEYTLIESIDIGL